MATVRTSSGITTQGFGKLRKALIHADADMRVKIAAANFEVAEEVTQAAKAKGQSLGSVAALAARSLRSSRSATYAAVLGGGARAPYFFGAEFGALQYKQFKGWTGNGMTAGYFLHPTIRAHRAEIMQKYNVTIETLLRGAFH